MLMIAVCIFYTNTIQAAWLEKYPVTITQPDGTPLALFLTGDEYHHRVHDDAGYTLLRNSDGWVVYAVVENDCLTPTNIIYGSGSLPGDIQPNLNISPDKWRQLRKNSEDAPKLAGKPERNPKSVTLRTGTLNNIVIYISFPDGAFNYTKEDIESLYMDPAPGASLFSYYRDISDDNFNVLTTFYPQSSTTILSYQAPNPRSYYELEPGDPNTADIEQTLLKDAIYYCKSEIESILSAEDIDSDGDGYVDNINFVVQGAPGAWSSLLWPHMWALFKYDVFIHDKLVWYYNLLIEEHFFSAGNGRQSVLVHETYHTLGAPDLYCYGSTYYDINPVGQWCVMSGNCVPPQSSTAHLTNVDGRFISDIPAITQSGTYTLYDTWDRNGNPVAYKIASPTSPYGEFFVLEYRRKTGGTVYESAIPNQGIVISRINPTEHGNASSDGVYTPFGVYMYRQNGTYTNNGNINNAVFSSSGLTTFSDNSSPNAFLSNGSTGGLGGIIINNFSAAGGETMTFQVIFPSTPFCDPVTEAKAEIENCTTATITWNPVAEAIEYKIKRDGALLETVTTPTFTETANFEDGKTYTWTIQTNCGETVSEEVSVSAKGDCPEKCNSVTEAAATIENCTTATITWTEVEEAIEYEIRRDDIWLESVTTPTFTETADFEDGKTYTWTIKVICEKANADEFPVSTTADCVGINEFSNSVTIFPNPANASVTINAKEFSKVEIYNAIGQLIEIKTVHIVDVSSYNNGVYLFKIYDINNNNVVKRVMVEK
jgi:M6 family metalloprotease-like protein